MAGPWIGKWEMTYTDNYDEFLKEVGVGLIKRKLAASAKPTLVYTATSNGQLTQRTETTLKTFEITYTPGVEFEEMTADDRIAKSVVTIDGNKLIHKQRIGELEATTVREFGPDEVVVTFTSGSVVAVRKFKKVA